MEATTMMTSALVDQMLTHLKDRGQFDGDAQFWYDTLREAVERGVPLDIHLRLVRIHLQTTLPYDRAAVPLVTALEQVDPRTRSSWVLTKAAALLALALLPAPVVAHDLTGEVREGHAATRPA